MFVIFEILGYLIIEFLFALPGAFIRWIHLKISGKENKRKEYSTQKAGWYYIAGLILVMVISLSLQLNH